MLVAKFNCPKCDAVLKPAAPQPVGKKLACPKCAGVFAVPLPEIEPATKRASARRPAVEGEEDERPSRRSRREEDEDEGRPKRPRKKSKKAKGGGSGLKVALLVGAILLVVAGLGVGGFFLFGSKLTSNISKTTAPYIQLCNEVAATLSTVKDQASAKAAEPKLLAQAKQLRQLDDQDKNAIQGVSAAEVDRAVAEAIADARRNPAKAKALSEKFDKEQHARSQASYTIGEEVLRVNKIPGGKQLIAAFYAAWGKGSYEVSLWVSFQESDGPSEVDGTKK